MALLVRELNIKDLSDNPIVSQMYKAYAFLVYSRADDYRKDTIGFIEKWITDNQNSIYNNQK